VTARLITLVTVCWRFEVLISLEAMTNVQHHLSRGGEGCSSAEKIFENKRWLLRNLCMKNICVCRGMLIAVSKFSIVKTNLFVKNGKQFYRSRGPPMFHGTHFEETLI
jgi:hypothetical protein